MCETVQGLIPEYVLCELTEEARRAVSEHLDSGCPDCRWLLAIETLLHAVYRD